jgi:hypothetical protein
MTPQGPAADTCQIEKADRLSPTPWRERVEKALTGFRSLEIFAGVASCSARRQAIVFALGSIGLGGATVTTRGFPSVKGSSLIDNEGVRASIIPGYVQSVHLPLREIWLV